MIAHVWQHYNMDPETLRRHEVARRSWSLLWKHPNVIPSAVKTGMLHRSSLDVGDDRPIPYINDIFSHGTWLASSVIYTNTDVGFLRDPMPWIAEHLDRHGCCYMHRVDFDRLTDPPTEGSGRPYGGADLFALTKAWWDKQALPDMLAGYEGWDFVMKRAMNRSGFPMEPTYGLFHENHQPRWKTQLLTGPGQKWNRKVCAEWAKANGFAEEILNESGGYLFK